MLTLCLHRRAQNHIRHLLELIDQFPRVNPSAAAATAAGEAAASNSEVDIPRLFRQIRSRYKVLCATLGIRPTLRAADASSPSPDRQPLHDDPKDTEMEATPSAAATGRAKSERKKVWAVHDPRADNGQSGGMELSF